jgi:hypothetical protein
MALTIHKGDYQKMRDEDAILQAMRASAIEPGMYMFPCAGSRKAMGSPEMIEKLNRGPVGWLTVVSPGGFNLGKSLAGWFVYCLIVGVLVAYVGWHGLGPGAGYLAVFRITGTAAVLGYAVGHLQDSIWKGASWGTTAKFVFDGAVYGFVTGGTFGWLWPQAA